LNKLRCKPLPLKLQYTLTLEQPAQFTERLVDDEAVFTVLGHGPIIKKEVPVNIRAKIWLSLISPPERAVPAGVRILTLPRELTLMTLAPVFELAGVKTTVIPIR
jgi:hypothetical protein